MSLSVWQENYAVDLRAKGFPPREVARILSVDETTVRTVWPRLVRNAVAAIAPPPPLPAPPRPRVLCRVKPQKPVFNLNGVAVQPLKSLPVMSPRIRAILKAVAERHDLPLDVMLARRNLRPLVYARQAAMHELVRVGEISLTAVGRVLGGFDHTTIMHGIRAHLRRQAA
jgi:hypothetical protein